MQLPTIDPNTAKIDDLWRYIATLEARIKNLEDYLRQEGIYNPRNNPTHPNHNSKGA